MAVLLILLLCFVLCGEVLSYSVDNPDHSGSCTYNFQVWTPNQDIINRIQQLESRCDNISSNLKADLKDLRHLLESQNFISQNVSNNYDKQILQYKFDDVKLDTAIKDLKLEVMENRAEASKIWAFLNQLQSSVLKNLISNSNNIMATEQSLLNGGRHHNLDAQLSDTKEPVISELKNRVGDLKAEWVLLRRDMNGIQSTSSHIKTNMMGMEEDTMTLKSSLDLVKSEVRKIKEIQSRLNSSMRILKQELGKDGNGGSYNVDWGEIPYDDEIYDDIVELREQYTDLRSNVDNITKMLRDGNGKNLLFNNDSDFEPSEIYTPRDCHDIYKQGHRTSAVYQIKPDKAKHFDQVYCEISNNTGWTVLQRRQDGMLSFSRMWMEYKFGFGNLYGEFWLGNEMMHKITSQKEYLIRIDMWDWDGGVAYAEYDYFHIDSEETFYQLKIGRYSGTAGDSWHAHDERSFSTEDSDNDLFQRNCAAENKGGWWYHSCYDSNLNGIYRTGRYGKDQYADGIVWYTLKNTEYYSLKKVEMKIRPLYV